MEIKINSSLNLKNFKLERKIRQLTNRSQSPMEILKMQHQVENFEYLKQKQQEKNIENLEKSWNEYKQQPRQGEGFTNSPIKKMGKNSKDILKKVIPLGRIDLKNDNYLAKSNTNIYKEIRYNDQNKSQQTSKNQRGPINGRVEQIKQQMQKITQNNGSINNYLPYGLTKSTKSLQGLNDTNDIPLEKEYSFHDTIKVKQNDHSKKSPFTYKLNYLKNQEKQNPDALFQKKSEVIRDKIQDQFKVNSKQNVNNSFENDQNNDKIKEIKIKIQNNNQNLNKSQKQFKDLIKNKNINLKDLILQRQAKLLYDDSNNSKDENLIQSLYQFDEDEALIQQQSHAIEKQNSFQQIQLKKNYLSQEQQKNLFKNEQQYNLSHTQNNVLKSSQQPNANLFQKQNQLKEKKFDSIKQEKSQKMTQSPPILSSTLKTFDSYKKHVKQTLNFSSAKKK